MRYMGKFQFHEYVISDNFSVILISKFNKKGGEKLCQGVKHCIVIELVWRSEINLQNGEMIHASIYFRKFIVFYR